MAARGTIVLKGEIERRYDEGRVAAALVGKILPGYLIEMDVDGEYQSQSVAGAAVELAVAVEDDFRGMTVLGTLPSDGVVAGGVAVGYVAGDLIRFHRCMKGDEVQLVLKNGQTVTLAPDQFLTGNGDGTMKLAGVGDARLFKPLEAMTASGDTLIRARAL